MLFADLAPLIGADSNAKQKARGGDSKQPADKVLPVEEFKTDRWRDMDADVEFTGKRIVHSEKLPFNDLYTHLVLTDGVLSLEPLRFGVAGGKLDAQIRLNGHTDPLEGQAKLTARGFKLKQLFPTFEPMKTSFGELNGDADISGRGNSVAKLLGSANGNLKMLINDGAISRELMELAGLNVGNYVVGKIFGDKEVKINCAAADFDIKTGLATTRLFVFDTENAIIYIDGTANMATEQLDLTITPESKGWRLISLRSPLYVRGKFIKPDAGVKAVPLMLRGAGMVALGVIAAPAAGLLALVAPSGGEPNQCAPLLEQMKAGKAPVTVKPPSNLQAIVSDAIASRLAPTLSCEITGPLWERACSRKRSVQVLQIFQDVRHVIRMLFFLRQDVFEDASGGRVFFADVLNDLAVAVDGDPLGDQVFVDHLLEGIAGHVLGVGVFRQQVRVELRLTAQLHDAFGQSVGVLRLPALHVRGIRRRPRGLSRRSP